MNKWKKKCGIAIAVHSFIATEKYQLSIITGDYILVNEGNDDWLQGRNIFTHKLGIFPLPCVSFIEQNTSSISSFLSKKSDLLIYEAEMTIRYAFIKLASISTNPCSNISPISLYFPAFIFDNPSTYLKILNLISDVTSQIEKCNNRLGNSAILAHSSLGLSVDNLREALGLKKNQRSLYSTMSTISTWGRKIDPIEFNTSSISMNPVDQPLILHIHFEIQEISKPLLCQFNLYDAINKSFLSEPISLSIEPDNTEYYTYSDDFFYENLEKKYLSNSLYLIIYTFDMKEISLQSESYIIRKCSSCVLVKLPDINNDSLCSPNATEAKSFTTRRGKFNILSLPETISNNISLFQLNNNKSIEEKNFINELDRNDEYEDHNYDNDIGENENKTINFTLHDSRRYTRKTLVKGALPPLLFDTPNSNLTNQSSFSPPSSARTSGISHSRTLPNSIPPSSSVPNIAMTFSNQENQSFLVSDALGKLNVKMSQYPLNFKIKITSHSGYVQDAFNEENLHKGRIISPLHLTSFTTNADTKSILKINLRKLKLDVYHKYSLVIIHLLDTEKNKFVKCFQSFYDPTLFNSDSWICPAIKPGIEDQFFDFFSINLDSTDLPRSTLLFVFEVFKINSGFQDSKPLITSYGLLPLFQKSDSTVTQNEGEVILYNFQKQLEPNEIVSTFIQKQESTQISTKQRRQTWKKNDSNSSTTESSLNLKQTGSISYRLDSNFITQYVNMYKLFHFREYTDELRTLIKNFMFNGNNQWLAYSSKILLNLCSIISSMGSELASEAFRALQIMLSSLNTRYNDRLDLIVGLFEKTFDQTNNSGFFDDLQELADVMLPLIIEKLSTNPEINSSLDDNKTSETDSEFRELIKTLPLFLQLVSRSYALKPSYERKTQVRKIFDLLNQIMKKDISPKQSNNDESEDQNSTKEQEEVKILMNQRLLVSHFWKFVDILPSCFDKSFASDVICSFVSCIRDDKESLFADKMKLLIKLSSSDIFWANNTSKNKLNDMLTKVLNFAVSKSKCMDDVFDILAGIMYSSNSRFVISFLPLLESLIDTNRHDRQLNHMLLSIAFNFPESFPLRILNKLLFPLKKSPEPKLPSNFKGKHLSNLFVVDYEDALSNNERLFIYMYVLFYQKEDILKKFNYKIFDIFEINNNDKKSSESRLNSFIELSNNPDEKTTVNTIRYKLFFDAFYLAISTQKPEISAFDTYLSFTIYNFNNNFSILTYIFRNFPLNQRLFIPMIQPVLHCMILYPSKDLAELFYLILKADIKLNKDPMIVRTETLNALWKISSRKYGLNGNYYNIKKEKVTDENGQETFVEIYQKDEKAFEKKITFKKLYDFNELNKDREFVDLATTLFSRESIPKKNETKKQTLKYKKALVTKEQIRKIINEFADNFSSLVQGISEIRVLQNVLSIIKNNDSSSLSDLVANEDRLLESLRVIIHALIEIKNEKFRKKMMEIICRFHLICGNNLEAALSLGNYLDLIPCTNEFLFNINRKTLQLFITKKDETNSNENTLTVQQSSNGDVFKFKFAQKMTLTKSRKNTVTFNYLQNEIDNQAFNYNCVGGWNSKNSVDDSSPYCLINGREFHVGVLLKMIHLCIKSCNESVAIKFIDQLHTTCVSKFRLIELMPLICNMKRNAFQKINTRSTCPYEYFRVSFYGKKFDKFYKNRTFIYRRDYKLDGLNKFRKELKDIFPDAITETTLTNCISLIEQKQMEFENHLVSRPNSISNLPRINLLRPNSDSKIPFVNNLNEIKENPNCMSQLIKVNIDQESSDTDPRMHLLQNFEGQFILYQKAEPATQEEINDAFYFSDNLPSYISSLSGGSNPTVFRCETQVEQEAQNANICPVIQQYLRLVNNQFPAYERRAEVEDIQKSTTRKLDAITYATLLLTRNAHILSREEARIKPFIDKMIQFQLDKENDQNANDNNLDEESKEEIRITYDSLLKYSTFLTFLMQNNAPYWICYKNFYSDDYIQNNPDDKEKVEKLGTLYNTIKEKLTIAINNLSKLKALETLQKDIIANSQLFEDLKHALSHAQNQ